MDLAKTMVKLFNEETLPQNIFFKYGRDRYRITWVRGDKVGYQTKDGANDSLRMYSDREGDTYSIRSVFFEGSRLTGKRKLIIDITV